MGLINERWAMISKPRNGGHVSTLLVNILQTVSPCSLLMVSFFLISLRRLCNTFIYAYDKKKTRTVFASISKNCIIPEFEIWSKFCNKDIAVRQIFSNYMENNGCLISSASTYVVVSTYNSIVDVHFKTIKTFNFFLNIYNLTDDFTSLVT